MTRRSVVARRRKMMLATRQVGAFLSLMVVQDREDGETLVSVMPLPY